MSAIGWIVFLINSPVLLFYRRCHTKKSNGLLYGLCYKSLAVVSDHFDTK